MVVKGHDEVSAGLDADDVNLGVGVGDPRGLRGAPGVALVGRDAPPHAACPRPEEHQEVPAQQLDQGALEEHGPEVVQDPVGLPGLSLVLRDQDPGRRDLGGARGVLHALVDFCVGLLAPEGQDPLARREHQELVCHHLVVVGGDWEEH